MKCRESGMPDERVWATFFDADTAMARLWPEAYGNALELGGGFGTFTLAAARRTTGIVTTLDIDPALIVLVRSKAEKLGIANIQVQERDFVASDLGVAPGSQSHVMVYNLLHMEEPIRLLQKARHALGASGTISVMHWRSDVATPRGPPLDIRPTPEASATWLSKAGFSEIVHVDLRNCCPFHYGITARR